ncbi:S-adenosyl-L-methionine-dependent methyltransferase [Annulohypoxylon bovei var. microspora]|nr:S-adenosyl-L-methionine-dependent methyltransferase [Annulohypoxylon bovei var. microspora]
MAQQERLRALEYAKSLVECLSGNIEEPLPQERRARAVRTATALAQSLMTPDEGLFRVAFSPAVWVSVRICAELGVFAVISNSSPASAKHIATQTNADESLIRRFLRVLTAAGYVDEVGDGVYGSTKWTRHMQSRLADGMIKFTYDNAMPQMVEAPKWFKMRGYNNPPDPSDGLFQAAFNTQDLPFIWLARPENKEYFDNGNTFFEGSGGPHPPWVTWFPVAEKFLSEPRKSQEPLLVDIGGGRGQSLQEFIDRFPEESGPFVLQDQEAVLKSATSLAIKAEKRALDFFCDSPVTGARIYYMKSVMHDWVDKDCVRILKSVASSMTRGYSYLVLNEFILPDIGCALLPATADIMMMAFVSGMERSETQWVKLLTAAGLAIEGFYQPPNDGQGIIVATLA